MAVRPLTTTVLDACLSPDDPMWGDPAGGWVDPALEWVGVLAAAGVPVRAVPGDERADLADSADSCAGEGLLIVPHPDSNSGAVERAQRAGRPVILGAPPPTPTAALASVREALGALVRPDLRGVVVLRLDDPGSAAKRHLAGWAHENVSGQAWSDLWRVMRTWGRISVLCCPGWVDVTGTVVPSRRASPEEWDALDEGVTTGLADLECHGFTHLDPDRKAWAAAPDRFTSEDWYREMWPPNQAREPTVAEQAGILTAWQDACGPGTTLVAPGEAWGLNTVTAARQQGFSLFNSWSVCRLDGSQPVPTWVRGIASPYLDQPDPAWLAEGLPTICYWHDRDMAVHGPSWVPDQLELWRDCGATRAWAFSDLTRAWSTPIDAALVDGEVVIRSAPPVPLLIEGS